MTLGLHFCGPRIDPGVWMQAHKSAQIFSFLPFPSGSVECLCSVFCSHLCPLWPCQYTHPLKHFSQSNLTSLGHFILKAKHGNLVDNVHTQRTLPTHGLITLRQQRGRRSETQLLYDKSATQNLPFPSALSTEVGLWGSHLLSVSTTGSSGPFSFYNFFFSVREQPLSSALLLRFFFSTVLRQPHSPVFLMLSAHHFHFSGRITHCF